MIPASARRAVLPPALVLMALALLSGCGTVSREQCQAGDWYQIGLVDGRNGEPGTLIAEHAKSCERYKLPVDGSAWERGRQDGLKDYCTPVSGFANGVSGKSYQNVCSGAAGADFLTAYSLGSEVHRARRIADEARAEARRAADYEDDLEDEIRRLRDRLDGASEEERAEIRERIRDLRSRRFDFVGDRFAARADAAAAERDADLTEARVRSTFIQVFGYPPL